MRISTRLTLLTVSAVSAAAAYALVRVSGARGNLAGDLRRMGEQVRRMAERLPAVRAGQAAPEGAAEGTPGGALLERALAEERSLEEMEKAYIRLVLERARGNQTRAAEVLGISRRTLYRKLRDYGISVPEEEA